MADETFGKGGYRIVEVPSEVSILLIDLLSHYLRKQLLIASHSFVFVMSLKKGKDIPKHYLRYTKDPSA